MASAKATIDHDEIRQWVEARGGHPAHVTQSGDSNDPGILRIDYPGYSGQGTLERISWDEFFDWFDRDNLAFLYQDESDSRFSKFVDRGTVDVSAKRAGTRPRSIVERITSAVTGRGSRKPASRKASSSKKRTAAKKRSASSSKKRSAKKASSKKRTSAKKASSKKRTASKSSKKRTATKRTPAKKRTSGRSARSTSSRSAVTTTSHDEIRKWVESRGGFPAHVKRTGSRKDPGVLRIDYPGYSGKQSLERISWDDWFNWFDRDKLAFLYQNKANSRFSKLVRR